ncbi:hypothetical protein [Winogradskyella sp. PG-2]|uniref:hypothetical protein n=1 Tax=Winogradskyella sp. PG-2 TaxID=754409 RepID=UPI00045891FE|nr:hypothetical protein [Winogradskyella sp. PG-2]BAO76872.1 hypothetical protein WPG_2642 [Winogradskyella sp. PG-2]
MKTLKRFTLLIMIICLNVTSCSIQDEIITEDDSEILSTDPANKDDDPEIEDPLG